MPSKEASNEETTSDERRTSEENDSDPVSEGQKRNSVYDFLYQDVRRVGSFLAQFDEHGVRQAVKATESVGKITSLKGVATGTLGLPAVMGGSAQVDSTTSDEFKDLAEHTFDPLWANSRRLLDYLTENDLINRNIATARLGQFILIEGSLSIIDTNMLAPVFENEVLFDAFMAKSLLDAGAEPDTPQGVEVRQTLLIMSKLPKVISLFIYPGGAPLWATLSADSLVVQPHDLAFKHGAVIRGAWNVLGILDAEPDLRQQPTEQDPNPQTLDEMGADVLGDSLTKVAANFTNLSRNLIGRPRTHFGITPLLIFREVAAEDLPTAGP